MILLNLKDVILRKPQQLPLYVKNTSNFNWNKARLIILLAQKMARNSAYLDYHKAYKKRFNWFQRTFG